MTSSGSTSSVTGGSSDLQECLDGAQEQADPACATCACNNCLAEITTCEADQTCVDLRVCSLENNCCDELCVLVACMDELTAAGGLSGAGTAAAIALKDCTEANSCACCD